MTGSNRVPSMRTNRTAWRALTVAGMLAVAACHPDSSADATAENDGARRQWHLPDRLLEISGLAFIDHNRVIAHDDEQGVLYVIDYATQRIEREIPMRQPPPRDDFEGIATMPIIIAPKTLGVKTMPIPDANALKITVSSSMSAPSASCLPAPRGARQASFRQFSWR